MRNGDHKDCAGFHTVNNSIRKSGEQTAPETFLDFRARKRKRHDSSENPIQLIKKLRIQSGRLGCMPCHRVINLELRRFEEAYFYVMRCLAITRS